MSTFQRGDRVRRTSDGRIGTVDTDCRDGWIVVAFPNDSDEGFVWRDIHSDYLERIDDNIIPAVFG